MFTSARSERIDIVALISVILLILISLFVLSTLSPGIFPQYYVFIVLGLVAFLVFFAVDFEVFETYSPHLYVLSIFLLIATLLIGQVTRGAVRWIPIGALTIQSSEIVRPFLLLFVAKYAASGELTTQRVIKACALFLIPFVLVLIQPSLGMSALLFVGFIGIFLASTISKKNLFVAAIILFAVMPLSWLVLEPYQKSRIESFISPEKDPLGAGYNSIQSMISVGSGMITGRGLGRGVQTQLAFLPEKHSDFVFAAISEEMGIIGSVVVLGLLFVVLWRLVGVVSKSANLTRRSFTTAVVVSLLAQIVVHVGMNMGVLPVTGIPLPLVSAGGSDFLSTMIALGLAFGSVGRDR